MKSLMVGYLVCNSVLAVDFQKEVKPILSNHCFHCHGPDSENRKAGLRLDTREGIFTTTPRGVVVVPGSSAESLLLSRVKQPKALLRMPPPYAHKDLSSAQIETLEKWVNEGAEWREHWAFRAPKRPAPPAVQMSNWVRNPIDSFILNRLERESLKPAAEESKERLMRRVSLDLTGLPPSLEELKSFLTDKRPDAYERMVDRYLATPAWGEHRGRYWMDAARYGDTHGLHSDNARQLWPWRDWVIQAFNRNLPFDQFTVEQLAGDLLPGATREQRVATGFHRNHIATGEGGVIPEEVKSIYVKDQVDTSAAVWMGLTLGCATCHDHKYDPFTQKDFYRMAAFFNNTTEVTIHGEISEPEPTLILPQANDRQSLESIELRLPRLRNRLADLMPKAAQSASEEPAPPGLSAKPNILQTEANSTRGDLSVNQPFTVQGRFYDVDEHDILVAGYNGPNLRLNVSIESFLPVVRMESADRKTQFALRGNSARIAPVQKANQEIAVTWDGSGKAEGITIYVRGRPVSASILPWKSLALEPGWSSNKKFTRGMLSYPRRLSDREVLEAQWQPAKTTLPLLSVLESNPEAAQIFSELSLLEAELRGIRLRGNVTLVMFEKAGAASANLLHRGQYDQPGEKLFAATPAVLTPMHEDWPKNRLGLARWITGPENPLTARVTVNRSWQEVFGTGLVKTAEDFGSTGEPPIHPELLDWLAVEFRESGWDVKRLFRLMMLSATYRQSAISNADKQERDPENRLVSRAPRYRMDAEMLRDLALKSSGLLNSSVGGASVRARQPEGIWENVAMLYSNTRFYRQDEGAALRRRSLYTYWKRSAPHPAMEILNAPTRETCVVRRERTNTPLQSLVTLNDPDFFEPAKTLATKVVASRLSISQRLDELGLRVLSRRWDLTEREALLRSQQRLQAYYRSHPEEAAQITGTAKSELASWVMLASLILNLDETLNK